jgi:uncharacterized protein involved in outer membrane biogenesis
MKFAGTRARRAAVITAAVLAVLVAVVAFFPWNALRGVVASAVSARLHRTVTIERLAVDLGWTTRVRIDGVTLANAEWSQTQPMATLPTTLLTFSIPSLFRLSPDAVHAVKPQVLLERSGSGEANWKFGEDGKSGAFVGAIDFEDGRVRYVDPTLRADINLSITGANSGQVSHLLKFKGGGTLRGESF